MLAAHRELTLGLNFERFMVIAGFVAFQSGLLHPDGHRSAAFGVPGVAGTADKCGAGIGKIDAVGHALIITGLIVMIIAGQHCIEMPALLRRGGIAARAGSMTLG